MNLPSGTDLKLQARDGLALHVVHFPVERPRGAIVLLHGLTEHARRHRVAAQQLNEAGWSVVSPDLRGHGESGGPRGGLQQDDDLLHDLAAALDLCAQHHPGLPRVLFGHSTGGAVAARFAAALAKPPEQVQWSRPIDGLILTSPALEASMSLIQKAMLTTMGRLMQDVPVRIAFKPEWVSSDPDVIRESEQDPLVHRQVTPRLARFIAQQGLVTMARASQWTCPTLLLYTPQDRLIATRVCESFAEQVGKPLMRVATFPSLAHDLLREPGRDQVFRAVRQWLDDTVPRQP